MERQPARIERAIIIAGALVALAVWFSSGAGRYQPMQQGLVLDTATGRACTLDGECFDFGAGK